MKETADGALCFDDRGRNADSSADDGKNIEIRKILRENVKRKDFRKYFENVFNMNYKIMAEIL